MRIPLLILASALLAVGAEVPLTNLGPWPQDIFNGKDLDGWEYIASGQAAKIADACTVEDGVIRVTGTPGKSTGYIVAPALETRNTSGVILHVEWRWTVATVTASTNGGILVNITPGPLQQGLWPVSFQVQTKSTRAGDIIAMSTASSAEAALGQTASRKADASEKPAGEWNVAEITIVGDRVSCTINGVFQNVVTHCDPKSGRVGFQLEGYSYELRNIRWSPFFVL